MPETVLTKISEMPASTVLPELSNPVCTRLASCVTAPKLILHRDYDTDIDPVTFEVIRHALWNINEEHGSNDPESIRLARCNVCAGSESDDHD